MICLRVTLWLVVVLSVCKPQWNGTGIDSEKNIEWPHPPPPSKWCVTLWLVQEVYATCNIDINEFTVNSRNDFVTTRLNVSHYSWMYAAVTWLKYCRTVLNSIQSINQSVNQLFNQAMCIFANTYEDPSSRSFIIEMCFITILTNIRLNFKSTSRKEVKEH